MIEIKADGQAEERLLALLYPATQSQPTKLGGELSPAATQQQLENLRFIVQEQRAQLMQAQAAIADYQQTLTAISTSPSPLLLSPAAPTTTGNSHSAGGTETSPRRYITGGLGQSDPVAVNAQTAQTNLPSQPPVQTSRRSQPRRQRRGLPQPGLATRLTRFSLVAALFVGTTWGVFKYAAPPLWSWLFAESPAEPPAEPSAKAEESSAAPTPESNLSETAPSSPAGSAASKAGTQPNALDL